jgi:hypothetical protein
LGAHDGAPPSTPLVYECKPEAGIGNVEVRGAWDDGLHSGV